MLKLTRRRFVQATAAILAIESGGLLTAVRVSADESPSLSPTPVLSAAPPSPASAGAASAGQPIDWARIDFHVDAIAPNFYTLTGVAGVDPGHPDAAGGRIGVLAGQDGLFMVDASYLPITDKVIASIRGFSAEPIRYLVNTHSHPDHTGGNPNIARQGALILARETARDQLLQPLPAAAGDAASRTDPARLPAITYGLGEPLRVHLNNEAIHIIPVPPAHTSGDSVVQFPNADVIMIGDFYRNYGYPFVDPSNGGTFAGVLVALETIMQLATPSTLLVPGHGTRIGLADLAPYRDMILDIQMSVQRMVQTGSSLQEVVAAHLTAPYDAQVAGGQDLTLGVTSADRFVSALYHELSGSQ